MNRQKETDLNNGFQEISETMAGKGSANAIGYYA